MDEIWKPHPGYPDYEVSSLGRVRSNKRGGTIILKPWHNSHTGYRFVTLYRRGKIPHKTTVHELVCRAFHGEKPTPAHQVAHGDGDKRHNKSSNLRWALPAENYADSVRHGTASTATQFKPRIPDDDIREIRRLLEAGWTQSKIADKFGIWQTAVSAIKTGRVRKNVI